MAQERASKPHDPLQSIRYQVADAVGGLMELWGFKRIMGRTWALLYLADAPLSAADLGDALQVSPGSVSMTVSELLKWGVVKKTWVPGDRRDFYLPETSVWKMVSRVIRERELVHVRDTNDQLAAAQSALAELHKTEAGAEVPREPHGEEERGAGSAAEGPVFGGTVSSAALPVLASRIAALQQLGQVGQLLIEQLLGGRTIDVVGLQAALNLVAPADSHAVAEAAEASPGPAAAPGPPEDPAAK